MVKQLLKGLETANGKTALGAHSLMAGESDHKTRTPCTQTCVVAVKLPRLKKSKTSYALHIVIIEIVLRTKAAGGSVLGSQVNRM